MMNVTVRQPLPALSSQERCFEHLKEQILRLEIAPGARINASEVAVRLGISRTPVREALGQLEKEALVAHEAAGGYVVRLMTVKEIDDLYRVREYLETEAVLEAMPNLGETDFSRLNAILDEADSHIGNAAAFLNSSRRFYSEIISATGNAVLERTIAPLRDRVRMIGAMLIEVYTLREKEISAENRAVLRALVSRDEAAAAAAVRAHVRNARQQIARMLAQDGNAVLVSSPGSPFRRPGAGTTWTVPEAK